MINKLCYFIVLILLVMPICINYAFGDETPLPTTWYLPEGCTDGFDEWILIQNPSTDTSADCTVTYMNNNGIVAVSSSIVIPPTTRYTIHVNDVVPNQSISAKIESDIGVIVERSMYWDSYGNDETLDWIDGHCSLGITETSTSWYFAEGCTRDFDEWILIQNPFDTDSSVHVTFMKGDGTTVERDITVSANTRYTMYVNSIISNQDVSVKLEVIAGSEILAERSMYWDKEGIFWIGGHCSPGITQPNTTWYFAEGSTNGFDEWILVQNPNLTEANVHVTFMKSNGNIVETDITVPATSRYSINVNNIVPNEAISAKLESDINIIAERSMYWDPRLNTPANKYIAFGDSITYGYGGSEGYPSRLERKLDSGIASSTVYNFGSPGEWTNSGLQRMEFVLSYYRVEYILLMEGSNDINSFQPVSEIISNLRGMIELAKLWGTKVILSSITAPLDKADEVNSAIQNLANEMGVPFVDNYSGLNSNRGAFMTDLLHPNDAGYEYMSTMWYDKILELHESNYELNNGRFAGHCSAGINETAPIWYLAEGCTDGFDEWVLIQNPDTELTADCTVTFMKPDGNTYIKYISVGPTSRYSIWVNQYVPNKSISTKVECTTPGVGVIVERSMYWDVEEFPWGGGHCSNGLANQ